MIVGGDNKALLREKLKKIASKNNMNIMQKQKPYNTWFGVCLTILGLPSAYSNIIKWIGIYFYSWYRFVICLISYPKYLFLDAGIDTAGEAGSFIRLLKPKVIVFGSISKVFDDDFQRLDIIQHEFHELQSYLNQQAKNMDKFQEEGTLNKVIEMINSGEKYFGVINRKYERLLPIGEKLIRDIYLIE